MRDHLDLLGTEAFPKLLHEIPAPEGLLPVRMALGGLVDKCVWEPIIPIALFEEVQELLSKNHCRPDLKIPGQAA